MSDDGEPRSRAPRAAATRDARGGAGTQQAEAIRRILLRAASEAHEDAGLSGLCAEGRWEAALDALRTVYLGPAGESGPAAPATGADDPRDGASGPARRDAASP